MTVLAGILSPIEEILTDLLGWLHSSVGFSWAWSIVALTVMVRFVLVPLTLKQIRSMQKLQQHAPELKAIQQKYKGDKQRMNEEVMKFYRENKVNPAASCLPMVLQIPVFISLFYVLRDFEKEVLQRFPESSLGFLHLVPNITKDIDTHWAGFLLLAVYVASQMGSTLLMPSTMDKKQRLLFLLMPFFFIPFIVNFPTGLMIYWVTTNLWTVGQGLITRRLMPKTALPSLRRTSRAEPGRHPPRPDRPDGSAPDGARRKRPTPPPAPPARAAKPGSGQAQRVRRRKKKGPRARR